MDRRKLLARLARGAVKNVAFADLQNLIEGLGFELRRVSGSHHIYAHPDVAELVTSRTQGVRPSPTRSARCSASSSGTV